MKKLCAVLLIICAALAAVLPAPVYARGLDEGAWEPPADDGVAPGEQHVYIESDGSSISGDVAARAADLRYIRALLSAPREGTEVNFYGSYVLTGPSGEAVMKLDEEAPYIIAAAEGALELRCAGGSVIYRAESFSFMEYAPPTGTDYNFFKLHSIGSSAEDRCYRGELQCSYLDAGEAYSSGAAGAYLVNRGYIEEYLKGVVSSEMGDDFGAAALEAQAIVARNFAVMSIRTGNVFDVYDTTASQAYRGIPTNSPNSIAAVEATAGKVLTYEGSAIKTYYSASNGGFTEVSTNEWNIDGSFPYESVKEDAFDLGYTRYIETLAVPAVPAGDEATVAALAANALRPALISAGHTLSDASIIAVAGIALAVNNDCADAACLRHHGDATANPCTHFCGLDATFTGTLDGVDFGSVTAHIKDTELYVGATPPYGFFQNKSLCRYWLTDGEGGYILRHGRYGHGVGLSQVGAMRRALAGHSATDILGFYYTGAEIEPLVSIGAADTLTALPSQFATDARTLGCDAYVYAKANAASLIIGVMSEGDVALVSAENDVFAKVAYNGGVGYIRKTAFEKTYVYAQITNVSTGTVIRSTPDAGSPAVLDSAPLGSSYALLAANSPSGWNKILCPTPSGDVEGYVTVKYSRLLTAEGAGDSPGIAIYPVSLALPEGYSDAKLWADGVAYDGAASGGVLTANLYESAYKTAVMYKYNADGVPMGMAVWALNFSGGAYSAQRLDGFNDLLSYHGFSARVTGNSGIRFKGGIAVAKRAMLTGEGIGGYTLLEYGIVTMMPSRYGAYPLVKGGAGTAFGRSYWIENGTVMDRITETVDGRYRFSSVLTEIPDENLALDYPFRTYIILTDGANTLTVYGAPMARSIYRIAKNRIGDYPAGSESWNFLDRIIRVVEGGA